MKLIPIPGEHPGTEFGLKDGEMPGRFNCSDMNRKLRWSQQLMGYMDETTTYRIIPQTSLTYSGPVKGYMIKVNGEEINGICRTLAQAKAICEKLASSE
jgi:hypothetical protein